MNTSRISQEVMYFLHGLGQNFLSLLPDAFEGNCEDHFLSDLQDRLIRMYEGNEDVSDIGLSESKSDFSLKAIVAEEPYLILLSYDDLFGEYTVSGYFRAEEHSNNDFEVFDNLI